MTIIDVRGKNYKDFNELLEDLFNGNEQEYWQRIGDIDNYLENEIDFMINYLKIDSLPIYTIINQDGVVSDTYRVFANGKYTFTIKEIETGKTYQESVDVTNIDTSLEYYYIDSRETNIYLFDKDNNQVEFQSAYIMYNGKRVDITPCIEEYSVINIPETGTFLEITEKIESWYDELFNTEQIFEIVKDGESYFGEVLICWLEV